MGQEAAREGLGAELGTKENRGSTLRLGKLTGKRGATGKTGVPRTNGHRPSRGGSSTPEGVALPRARRDHWDDLAREHRARMWIGR